MYDHLIQFLCYPIVNTEHVSFFIRYFKDGNESSSDHRNMKLKFTNKIPDIILTSQDIKVEGDACLEVSLVEDPSERTVDAGPEASARVQIVLLKGVNNEEEEEEEEFDQNIVPEIPGKKPLLDGDVAIRLERGVGVVQNIKLRNHAIKIKPPVFKLGARVVDGFRVKEARTGAFTVKDFRNKCKPHVFMIFVSSSYVSSIDFDYCYVHIDVQIT